MVRTPYPFFMDYNLRDLKFFETVATLGHVSRAAELLGRSQPAITKCIRRLEAAVGERLIERDGQGVTLTPSGLLLLERARPLLQHASQVQQELRDFSTGAIGDVRIGSGLSTAAHVLPQICARLLQQSGIRLQVLLGTNVGMRRELREGRIDLLIGLLPPDPDLRTVPLADDMVGPAVSAGHPLAARGSVTAAELMAWPWAMPTREIPSRQWWDRRLQDLQLAAPAIQMQSNSPALLLGIARLHDVIVFTSHSMLPEGLVALAVPELAMPREFGVALRREGYLSPAVRRTLELLESDGQALFQYQP